MLKACYCFDLQGLASSTNCSVPVTTSSVDKSVSSQKALQEEEEVKSKLQSAEQQQVSWQH